MEWPKGKLAYISVVCGGTYAFDASVLFGYMGTLEGRFRDPAADDIPICVLYGIPGMGSSHGAGLEVARREFGRALLDREDLYIKEIFSFDTTTYGNFKYYVTLFWANDGAITGYCRERRHSLANGDNIRLHSRDGRVAYYEARRGRDFVYYSDMGREPELKLERPNVYQLSLLDRVGSVPKILELSAYYMSFNDGKFVFRGGSERQQFSPPDIERIVINPNAKVPSKTSTIFLDKFKFWRR